MYFHPALSLNAITILSGLSFVTELLGHGENNGLLLSILASQTSAAVDFNSRLAEKVIYGSWIPAVVIPIRAIKW